MVVLAIIIILILNFAGACITRAMWGDVLEEKEWFCQSKVKIALVIPPIGLIGGVLTLVALIILLIAYMVYSVLIEPIIDYFKNCDI